MTKLTRRTTFKLAAAAAAPLILPARVFGADAPSKKINVGMIGVGWEGGSNMGSIMNVPEARVMAVCDLDEGHLKGAKDRVNKHYKDEGCKAYKDFRELLADKDVDAVCISTPDHWHAIPAIAAAKAGKHIFCEKPLSHSFFEGKAMVEAVEKAKVVWQTGSWQRSGEEFRWAVELVLNGYIGKIKRVEIGLPSGHSDFHKTGKDKPDCDPPSGVDYDFWVGPAQMMPFNPCRFHKNWRWNYNTGGGQLMDWIGHHCDIAHWGLSNEFGCGIGDDRIGPTEFGATAVFPDAKSVWNTATSFRIDSMYPGGIEVVIAGGHKDIGGGTKWIGDKGFIQVNRGRLQPSDKSLMDVVKKQEDTLKVKIRKPRGGGGALTMHCHDWIDCILKGDVKTLTPVAVAHRSQTPGHIGLIAARLGRKLKWDADKQDFVGDAEASKMLVKGLRAPWTL